MLVSQARNHATLFSYLREKVRIAGVIYFGVAFCYNMYRHIDYDLRVWLFQSTKHYPVWVSICQVSYFGLGVVIDYYENSRRYEVKLGVKNLRDYLGACIAFPSALFIFAVYIKVDYDREPFWALIDEPFENAMLYKMLCLHPALFQIMDTILSRKRYPFCLTSSLYLNSFCACYSAWIWATYAFFNHSIYPFLENSEKGSHVIAFVFMCGHYVSFLLGKILNRILWSRRIKWRRHFSYRDFHQNTD